ncbi:MAG: hypothetical protein JWO48_1192, partial [Bryobacterales bacterium]|nr:hypothetical protein [Bryobacterales bacterium]
GLVEFLLATARDEDIGSQQRQFRALWRTGWPTIFGQGSDAIVPLTSQQANFTGTQFGPISGVVHSAGVEQLGFIKFQSDNFRGEVALFEQSWTARLHPHTVPNPPQ